MMFEIVQPGFVLWMSDEPRLAPRRAPSWRRRPIGMGDGLRILMHHQPEFIGADDLIGDGESA